MRGFAPGLMSVTIIVHGIGPTAEDFSTANCVGGDALAPGEVATVIVWSNATGSEVGVAASITSAVPDPTSANNWAGASVDFWPWKSYPTAGRFSTSADHRTWALVTSDAPKASQARRALS